MAALTLSESAKLLDDGTGKAILTIYADTYHPLRNLPIQSRASGRMSWAIEDTLDSNVGARSIGSDFTEGTGSVKPYSSITKAYGGKIKVDDKIATEEPDAVSFYKAQQIRALSRKFTIDMFEGTGAASLKGLRDWVRTEYTGQNITTGSTVGGDLPTMSKMDSLLSLVDVIPGSTFIYSNYTPFAVMANLARTNGSGQQNIQWLPNQFGVQQPTYQGIPWIIMRDGAGTNMISTVETETGITSGTATSIYVVTYSEEMFTGFQSSAPKVENALDGTNFKTSRFDWYVGAAPLKPRSIARLANVKNALT